MAGRVTQNPRLVALEPDDPVARTTQVARRVAAEPTPALLVTQVSRQVLIPANAGDVTMFTTQVSRLVAIPADEEAAAAFTTQVSRRVAIGAPVVAGGERSYGYIIG